MASISISVVMPVRNGMPWIKYQLDALASQTVRGLEWEFIASDNGSTDGTIEVVHTYDRKIPNVSVADASRVLGISHARNVGVAQAQATHVVFCDADDIVTPSWLEAASHAFVKNEFLGGRLQTSAINTDETVLTRPSPTGFGLPQALGRFTYAVGANFGIARDLFLQVGGCDERFQTCFDDVDLAWRMRQKGVLPSWTPDMVVDYRLRDGLLNLWRQHRNYGEGQALFTQIHGLVPEGDYRLRELARLAGKSYMLARGTAARGQFIRTAAAEYGMFRGGCRIGVGRHPARPAE